MEKTEVIGYVHSTESFGSVDGPGIRFVSFLQGCRMRCEYCHNPDTWNIGTGTPYTPQELFDEAIRYKAYWADNGGVTVSGGEPLLQIDFIIEYFKICKANGVHTTIDTCGMPFTRKGEWFERFEELLEYTDLIMLDLKHIDDEAHKSLTMNTNQNILDMATYLSERNFPIWIRHVLVPERSDYDEFLYRLRDFVRTLNNVKRFEVLAYHTMGKYKWEELGLPYSLEGIQPPSAERVVNANEILETASYTGYKDM